MNTAQQNHSSEHKKVSLLLPWYVNKTLRSDETHLVETHLKSCLLCKIESSNLQKLSLSINQEDLFAPVAHASFLKLKNRIHKNEAPSKVKTIAETLLCFRLWFSRLNTKSFDSLYPPVVLASFLLLTFSLISPTFFAEKQNSTNIFHTLSSSKHITHKQNEIRLVFSNEITQNEILQIVNSVQGQIVAGPTAQGVYKVRIGKGEITSKNLIKTISLLRDKKQIIFAEPAFALPSTNNQNSG
jgi:hypothetical protein